MRKFFDNAALMALFAGLLTQIAFTKVNPVLAWVCYIPLFIALGRQSGGRPAFKTGVLLGLPVSILSFAWMVPGAERFTGSSILYGILVFLVSCVFMCLYFGFAVWLFTMLKKQSKNILLNTILAAATFTFTEALLMTVSKHLPWFGFHSGMGLAGNLYTIQPAQYFGIHILSFAVVAVNYLAAAFILRRQWLKLLLPAALVAAYTFEGWFINSQYFFFKAKGIPVALLVANTPPEMRWNENTGDALAQNMINLSAGAAADNPALALWSESAVPWTYQKDDDLVNELIKAGKGAGVTHILGINTAAADSGVYNSAYSILPNGEVTGRYDKQVMLSLIEKPLAGILFPFLSGNGFEIKHSGFDKPVNTPYGRAGIIICNEATVPGLTAAMVNNGAQFILNLSNDGWFSNSYLVDLHFYNVRLRAVEARKDIAVNSNCGYSGLVKASGQVAEKQKSQSSFIQNVTVQPNTITTLFSSYPLLFVYLCFAGLVVISAFNYLKPAKG